MVHFSMNANVLFLTTVDMTSVQCYVAAGFLHARQKAASHGNLASQDVDTSPAQDAGHSDHDAAPQPLQHRRHLLPQSMSAVLSILLTQSPAILLLFSTKFAINCH